MKKADLISGDAKVNPAYHHDAEINVLLMDEDHTPTTWLKQTMPPKRIFFI